MRNAQAIQVAHATLWVVTQMNDSFIKAEMGAPYDPYLNYLLVIGKELSGEEVVFQSVESLTQGTTGHNTNVCHVVPEGGGYLPFINGTRKYVAITDSFTFYDGSRVVRDDQRTLITRWRGVSWIKENYGWKVVNETLQTTKNKSTGELTYAGSSEVTLYYDIDADGHRCKVKSGKATSTSEVPTSEAENNAWAKVNYNTVGSRTTFNKSQSADPTYLNLGDKPWIALKSGKFPNLVEHVRASAFIDACKEFPRQADNQIANIADALSILRGAVDPEVVVESMRNALSTLGSLWMWWRYAYTTSLSDILQGIDYSYRKKMSMWQSCRYDGFASEDIFYRTDYVHVSCHCGFKTRIKPDKLYSNTSWQRGLELNEYTAWDMIPLSFVVDWFAGVGDSLDLKANLRHYLGDYTYSDMFFTTTYRAEVERSTHIYERFYTREYTGPPQVLRGSYIPNDKNPSLATQIKRGVDVLSLVQII